MLTSFCEPRGHVSLRMHSRSLSRTRGRRALGGEELWSFAIRLMFRSQRSYLSEIGCTSPLSAGSTRPSLLSLLFYYFYYVLLLFYYFATALCNFLPLFYYYVNTFYYFFTKQQLKTTQNNYNSQKNTLTCCFVRFPGVARVPQGRFSEGSERVREG